jgi:hypothetical protein
MEIEEVSCSFMFVIVILLACIAFNIVLKTQLIKSFNQPFKETQVCPFIPWTAAEGDVAQFAFRVDKIG